MTTREVRIVVRGEPAALSKLTGAGSVSGGRAYHPVDGLQVTYVPRRPEERGVLPGDAQAVADFVFPFLIGWAAGHGLDYVVGFIYERLRGTVDVVEVNEEEVLVEESALLDALRRATGEGEDEENEKPTEGAP